MKRWKRVTLISKNHVSTFWFTKLTLMPLSPSTKQGLIDHALLMLESFQGEFNRECPIFLRTFMLLCQNHALRDEETDVKCLSSLLLKAVLSFELLRPSQPRQSAGLEFSRRNTWPSLFLQGNVITQSPLVSHFLWITVCLRSCTCVSRRLKPAALRGDLILPSQILYYWVIYFMFWVFSVSYCIVDLT